MQPRTLGFVCCRSLAFWCTGAKLPKVSSGNGSCGRRVFLLMDFPHLHLLYFSPHSIPLPLLNWNKSTLFLVEFFFNSCNFLFVFVFFKKLVWFGLHVVEKIAPHKVVTPHPLVVFEWLKRRSSIGFCAEKGVHESFECIRVESWWFIFFVKCPKLDEIFVFDQLVDAVMSLSA